MKSLLKFGLVIWSAWLVGVMASELATLLNTADICFIQHQLTPFTFLFLVIGWPWICFTWSFRERLS